MSQSPEQPKIAVRPAVRQDADAVVALLRGLAVYENLQPPDDAAAARVTADLFGETPRLSALLADHDGQPAGLALFYETYSSFLGRPKLFLEDLFVLPEARSLGVGRALFDAVVSEAKRRGCCRVEWVTLANNHLGIRFYQRAGAVHQADWQTWQILLDS